jgi:hypothetical protein
MLRTSQERLMRRADELGVSLAISDDYDEPVVAGTNSSTRYWSG